MLRKRTGKEKIHTDERKKSVSLQNVKSQETKVSTSLVLYCHLPTCSSEQESKQPSCRCAGFSLMDSWTLPQPLSHDGAGLKGQDKDREIAHKLPSQATQAQLMEINIICCLLVTD